MDAAVDKKWINAPAPHDASGAGGPRPDCRARHMNGGRARASPRFMVKDTKNIFFVVVSSIVAAWPHEQAESFKRLVKICSNF
jgi:hypothetical protein